MPKKKTALTIEERLQQALVPAEEQPYEVPENWVWVYGKNIFMPMESRKPDGEDFYYIDIDAIDNKNQVVTEAKKIKTAQAPSRASRKLHTGDTVFSLVRPYLKNIAYIDVQLSDCIASTGFFVCTPNAALNDKYLYRLMVSSYVVDGLNKHMKGDNSPSIRKDDIENYPFPLPPLSEQQRIVERIEELFAKLDEAKERLQEVADSFAVRKAAILHKAFTGELTKKHEIEDSIVIRDKLFAERENMVQEKVLKRVKIKPLIQDEYKSQLAKNWVQCKLGEVAFVTKLAGFEYTKYIHLEDTGEIPVVRAQNVRKGYLDTTNLLYISKSVSDALSRSALKEKSVLITFIGAGIGDACVFDENQQYHLAPNVAKVEPFNKSEEKLNVYFLLYYLLSSFGQYEIFKNMKATAQPSLSMETIREIIIPLPSIEEQHEIVRLIDDLLARERAAQQATEQALASIELMKKSILARAFRGELGTNKASEASALELLKQVLAEG